MHGDVPKGWRWSRVGSECDVLIGGTPARDEPAFWDSTRQGTNRWVSIADLQEKVISETKEYITDLGVQKSNVKRISAGTVLMSFKLSIGRTAIAGRDLYTNEAIAAFVPKNAGVDREFVYYALPLAAEGGDIDQAVKGKTLNKAKLLDLEVLLPPLPEQKKIAAILSSVDEAIQATQAVIDQTRRVKEGLLQDLLTRGMPGHTRFKQTEIGEIPEGWEVAMLGDVAEVRSGIAVNANRELSDPVDVAYLRVANVQDGYLDLREVKSIQVERSDLSRYALRPGDVLMNEGGDIDKLGRGDLWDGQIEPCVHQNHVFSVRSGPRLRPRYLAYLAESPLGKAYFLATGKQTTNLASINKSQLRAFPLPLPPLDEQDSIVERLAAVRGVAERAEHEVRSLNALKSGLLQDLLTGRVRVTP